MKEVEKKILNVDIKEIQKKLTELGAKQTLKAKLITLYFDYPDRRFQQRKEICRLRTFGNKVEFTFKLNRSDKDGARSCDEKIVWLEISQWDNIKDMLTTIGLIQTTYFEKFRYEYELEKVKFELDIYPEMNPLLEIEAETPEEIDSWIQKLDLTDHEQTPETIYELFARLNPHLNLDGQTLKQNYE